MSYHINAKGEPGICKVRTGKCPFGELEDHFDSKKEARRAFEVRNGEDLLAGVSKLNGKGTSISEDLETWEKIPYTEDEVYGLALDELEKVGLVDKGWTIGFGGKTHTLGQCFHDKRQVEFSRLWLPILSKGEIHDLITHEVAHAVVGHDHGHDSTWAAQHESMGGDGKEFYDSSKGDTRDRYKARFNEFYPNGVNFGTRGGVAKTEVDPSIAAARRAASAAKRAAFIMFLKDRYLKTFHEDFDKTGLPENVLFKLWNEGKLTPKDGVEESDSAEAAA